MLFYSSGSPAIANWGLTPINYKTKGIARIPDYPFE